MSNKNRKNKGQSICSTLILSAAITRFDVCFINVNLKFLWIDETVGGIVDESVLSRQNFHCASTHSNKNNTSSYIDNRCVCDLIYIHYRITLCFNYSYSERVLCQYQANVQTVPRKTSVNTYNCRINVKSACIANETTK